MPKDRLRYKENFLRFRQAGEILSAGRNSTGPPLIAASSFYSQSLRSLARRTYLCPPLCKGTAQSVLQEKYRYSLSDEWK